MPYPVEDFVCCLADLFVSLGSVHFSADIWVETHSKLPESCLDLCRICIPLYPQNFVGVHEGRHRFLTCAELPAKKISQQCHLVVGVLRSALATLCGLTQARCVKHRCATMACQCCATRSALYNLSWACHVHHSIAILRALSFRKSVNK